jgi:hypothetical protein
VVLDVGHGSVVTADGKSCRTATACGGSPNARGRTPAGNGQGAASRRVAARYSKGPSEFETCFRHAIDIARRQSAKSLELRGGTSDARRDLRLLHRGIRHGGSEGSEQLLNELSSHRCKASTSSEIPMTEARVSRILTLVFADLADSNAVKRQRGDQAVGELISRLIGRANSRRRRTRASSDWAGDGCFLIRDAERRGDIRLADACRGPRLARHAGRHEHSSYGGKVHLKR